MRRVVLSISLLMCTNGFAQCPVPEARSGFQLPLDSQTLSYGWEFAEYASGYLCGSVYHPGVDIGIPMGEDCDGDIGQPVFAAANGKVRYASSTSWGGVVLEHSYQGTTWYTQYGHVQDIRVAVDECVVKGEQIAEIGEVGADCAHLHFEVRSPQHPSPTMGHYWNCTSPGLGSLTSVNSWYRNPEEFIVEHPTYEAAVGESAQTPEDAAAFQLCYITHGGQAALGDPQGSVVTEGNGQAQEFSFGGSPAAITLREGASEALLIYGAIYNKWASLGRGHFVHLGFPITEEGNANQSPYQYPPNSGQHTQGVYVQFENGTINHISNPVGHPFRGATHAVYGPIYTRFAQGGYSAWHGFPISDIIPWQTGYRMLVEEGGYIYTPDNGPAYFVSTTNPQSLVSYLANNFRVMSRWTLPSLIATTVQVFRRNLNLRSSLDEPELLATLPASTTEYLDSTVSSGSQYAYSVVALSDTIASPPSAESFISLDEEAWDYRIIATEYYFDNDPGEGNGRVQTFLPQPEFYVPQTMEISGLGVGEHTAYFRCLDARGIWSASRGKRLYVTPPSSVTPSPEITLAEYFFNDDPGFGNGEYLYFNSDQSVTLAELAGLWNVNPGQQTLYMRFRDSEGRWSAARGKNSYVTQGNGNFDAYVVQAEVYFDTDPGYGNGLVLAATDGAFDSSSEESFRCTEVVSLTEGWHNAFVRVQSSSDLWSEAVFDSFYVTEPVELNLTASFDEQSGNLILRWNPFPTASSYVVRRTDLANQPTPIDSFAVQDTIATVSLTMDNSLDIFNVSAVFCDSLAAVTRAIQNIGKRKEVH